MRLDIVHQTVYRYDQPLPYALQRVRLVPQNDALQTVIDWSLELDGATEQVRFSDHFGNQTRLLALSPGAPGITITARGTVETEDKSGVTGHNSGFAPRWVFLRQTPLTAPDPRLKELADALPDIDKVERLHALMALVGENVRYEIGQTNSATSASSALEAGSGVCQDHAHIFIAVCRILRIPARYVSGYLLMEGVTEQVASHAWAEAHIDGLGWVGFDVSNRISPDARYVRLAFGCDYRDANPISGIWHGPAQEELEVHITVEQ